MHAGTHACPALMACLTLCTNPVAHAVMHLPFLCVPQAVEQQLSQMQAVFDSRMAGLARAMAALDAYTTRLQYASDRLRFSGQLMRVSRSSSEQAAAAAAGASDGSGNGSSSTSGAGGGAGGLGGETTAGVVGAMHSEIHRLQQDRDQLLAQLSKATLLMDERVRAAEAAVREREARARHAIISEHLEVARRGLAAESAAKVSAALQASAAAVSQAREQAVAMAQAAEATLAAFQARAGSKLAGLASRMQALHAKVRHYTCCSSATAYGECTVCLSVWQRGKTTRFGQTGSYELRCSVTPHPHVWHCDNIISAAATRSLSWSVRSGWLAAAMTAPHSEWRRRARQRRRPLPVQMACSCR